MQNHGRILKNFYELFSARLVIVFEKPSNVLAQTFQGFSLNVGRLFCFRIRVQSRSFGDGRKRFVMRHFCFPRICCIFAKLNIS